MADPLRKLPVDEELENGLPRSDPFRYGSRWRQVRLPGGEVIDQEIPLTPDDLLDPQLGDEVTQSGPHAKVLTVLNPILDRRFEHDPGVLVLFDMKILWGIPGIPDPSPDLAIVRGARDKERERSVFKVAEEGVLPCLVIEVVSYSDAEIYQNDHEKKVEIYQRVGIPEYIIVDPYRSPAEPLLLTGYRLAPDGRYRRIAPDSRGRLLSETTSLFFAPSEDRRMIRVGDAETGKWLRTLSEESEAREDAEERARAAEQRAQETEAELARLRGELDSGRQANSRQEEGRSSSR